ncbi:hypothetical protein AAII07_46240 [Microvirga sp. 0TCS3.31]
MSGTSPDVDDVTNLFRDENGNPLQFGHLSSFGLDGQGNLYAISYADNTWGNDTGRIFRLSDNTPVEDVGDSLNGAGGNDTIYGGGGNDTIHGGDDNDHVYGDADHDYLYGDAGADTLNGGAGNDIYYVDSSDIIEGEGANGGTDLVRALNSFTLQDGQVIEALQAHNQSGTSELDLMIFTGCR